MKVLVACEYSGTVREAFRKLGHDAWSCDILDCDDGSKFHIKDDVLKHLDAKWDLMIAHPPCTHLAVSGAKHFHRKAVEQAEALDFVRRLLEAPISMIALENPVSIISSRIRKPDQIVQPYMFGHEATKKTCLWLKNLPKLEPTKIVDKGARHITKSGKSLPEWYNLPPSADRWKIRSKTFQGLADAMASQWNFVVPK
jgi:site-specific DNA-cytosine methylase